MKIIIAGSRNAEWVDVLIGIYKTRFFYTEKVDCIISGGATGADLFGEKWAKSMDIPIERFIPDWDEYGKSAGMLRNIEMANHGNCLLAIWDEESKGTKQMIEVARNRKLLISVFSTKTRQFL